MFMHNKTLQYTVCANGWSVLTFDSWELGRRRRVTHGENRQW